MHAASGTLAMSRSGLGGGTCAYIWPRSWRKLETLTALISEDTVFTWHESRGLSDIVRIGYGEVCYWPNLGYGRFGAKVAMGNAPVFESPDIFDPRRIHLADIDGSGNSDIIYIARKASRFISTGPAIFGARLIGSRIFHE
jgi:hypothetical protein